jgi:hypothetical protein
VGVQEVRCDKGGKVRARYCILFYEEGNENHQLVTEFFTHKKISTITRVEFLSDRLSYTVLRGVFILIRMQRLGRKLKT